MAASNTAPGGTLNRHLNRLQNAIANDAADIGTATTSDRFLIFDQSDAPNTFEAKWADGANLLEAAGVPTASALNKVYLELDINDGTAEATYYLLSPVAGTISKIYTVIDGVVSTADITLTTNIGATAVTNGVVTIATAASAAGDIDVATPTALNVITAWAAMNFVVTGGGAGGTPRIHVTVEITRS